MLSKLQTKILNNHHANVFVESAAASGKTALLIEKTREAINDNLGPVVAFTFTNAAAEEMSKRLGDYDHNNVFIGTIHAYCLRLLLAQGVTQALDYVEEQWFDQLFSLLKKHLECIKPIYFLLVDEMQDCNSEQFDFIFQILQPQKRFMCYDKRQSIYRWRDAHPEYIDDLINEVEDSSVEYMNENYRNGSYILDFAKSIIRQAGYEYSDMSVPMRDFNGRVVTVDYSPVAIARTIKRMGNYKDWFVLARTNDQVDEMMYHLEKEGVPACSFKRAQLSNSELYEKLQSDEVKVLTIHTSKGLEAKNVVVIGARFYDLEEKCVGYVAATRARDLLVWAQIPTKPRRAKMVSNWER